MCACVSACVCVRVRPCVCVFTRKPLSGEESATEIEESQNPRRSERNEWRERQTGMSGRFGTAADARV